MRVIMDYMYKDHLDATSSATFPMPLVQSLLQYLQQQLTKNIKAQRKRDRERRENGIVFLLWIRNRNSIF